MAVTAPAPGNPLQTFYENPGVPLSSGPDRARRQARMLAGILRGFDGPAELRSTSASIRAWRRARSGPELSGTAGPS